MARDVHVSVGVSPTGQFIPRPEISQTTLQTNTQEEGVCARALMSVASFGWRTLNERKTTFLW